MALDTGKEHAHEIAAVSKAIGGASRQELQKCLTALYNSMGEQDVQFVGVLAKLARNPEEMRKLVEMAGIQVPDKPYNSNQDITNQRESLTTIAPSSFRHDRTTPPKAETKSSQYNNGKRLRTCACLRVPARLQSPNAPS